MRLMVARETLLNGLILAVLAGCSSKASPPVDESAGQEPQAEAPRTKDASPSPMTDSAVVATDGAPPTDAAAGCEPGKKLLELPDKPHAIVSTARHVAWFDKPASMIHIASLNKAESVPVDIAARPFLSLNIVPHEDSEHLTVLTATACPKKPNRRCFHLVELDMRTLAATGRRIDNFKLGGEYPSLTATAATPKGMWLLHSGYNGGTPVSFLDTEAYKLRIRGACWSTNDYLLVNDQLVIVGSGEERAGICSWQRDKKNPRVASLQGLGGKITESDHVLRGTYPSRLALDGDRLLVSYSKAEVEGYGLNDRNEAVWGKETHFAEHGFDGRRIGKVSPIAQWPVSDQGVTDTSSVSRGSDVVWRTDGLYCK